MDETIYEIGIIKHGLPIVKVSFEGIDELIKKDPLLISGFVQVLQDFSVETFQDVPETLQLSKFIAFFQPFSTPVTKGGLILYALISTNYDLSKIRNFFNKLIIKLESDLIAIISSDSTDEIKNKIKSSILVEMNNIIEHKQEDEPKYRRKLGKF